MTTGEEVLQKAEAAFVKLHPLAAQGNDVAPITRGELRTILDDLIAQLGQAAGAPDLQKVRDDMAAFVTGIGQVTKRVVSLEKAVSDLLQAGLKAPKPDPVVQPPVDTSGVDSLLKLTREQLLQVAKDHNIDISAADGQPDEVLANLIAATLNVLSGSGDGTGTGNAA
jgi:hypothetical protein